MGKVRRRTQKKSYRRNKSVSSKRRSVSKLNKKQNISMGGWQGNKKSKKNKKLNKQSGGGWGSPKVYQPEMVGGWGGSESENESSKQNGSEQFKKGKYSRNFSLEGSNIQTGGWGGSRTRVYDVNSGRTSLVRKYFKKHFH